MKLFELISLFTYSLTKLIPKKKNRWIFGAWFGTAISDNTKAISDYIENNYPEIEMIWITNYPEKISLKHGIAVKRNSIESLKYIVTAKVAIMNQGFGDFNAYNFLGGCYKVQLWHGVTWKKIFRDVIDSSTTFNGKIYDRIFNYINQYDLYLSPSDMQTKIIQTAFHTNVNKVLQCGQPRNVVLFSKDYRAKCRKKLFKEFNIKEKKVVVYMPTFRDREEEVFSFGLPDIVKILKSIENKYNFILIEKSHYATQKKSEKKYKNEEGLYFMPNQKAEFLLSVADILITDYSSCFFDFLITDRPIIHYIYDYEYYVNEDSGVYFKKEEVLCGDAPENEVDLWNAIIDNLSYPEKNAKLRKKQRTKFVTYESSKNNEKVFAAIQEGIKI